MAEAQLLSHSCWIQLACLQPLLSTEGKTALSAASSADVASGIMNLSFFYFTPWSLLLCVNDHHPTGFVNVIQLVL